MSNDTDADDDPRVNGGTGPTSREDHGTTGPDDPTTENGVDGGRDDPFDGLGDTEDTDRDSDLGSDVTVDAGAEIDEEIAENDLLGGLKIDTTEEIPTGSSTRSSAKTTPATSSRRRPNNAVTS